MKQNVKYAAIWFLIGFALIKFLGWDQLADQRETAGWRKIEATVQSCNVTLAGNRSDYNLGIQFRADIDDSIHSYTCFRSSGPKGQMDKLAETTYAPGATIAVFINPDDPAEYRFPQRALGPWLVGILPGAFFILMGLSVLRAPKKEPSTTGIPE
ncbi:hypothetical protein PDESU_03746 [Pontiella desulfatans]|uniref:DUF3592 domain-containing protein n=1 Tax=Pontiella desulfatans TaxID=2750659 RepID=A0A6C2U6W1_PONDE|nr:DUF3592 domain-containing protein [Pontiella desulfatans]VGO15164.1 hypothetical protein PDESU_03746 [Pontiella desulfatans]